MCEKIIAACGNDCAVCPRYTVPPYTKTAEELHHTAELWYKIGYRDHVVTNEEIACTGCKEENWCRYRLVKCVNEKHIAHCGQCENYPCDVMKACFTVTGSFIPTCKKSLHTRGFRDIAQSIFRERKEPDAKLRQQKAFASSKTEMQRPFYVRLFIRVHLADFS